jgi:hypothetical protein
MRQPLIMEREKVINAPIGQVWAFLEPAENISEWMPGVLQSETITGSGLGRKQLLFLKWGKKDAEIVQEVFAYELGKFLGWKHLRETLNGKPAPQISIDTRFMITLLAAGEGTRVSLRSENIPGNFVKSLIFKTVGKRRIEAILSGAFRKIETGLQKPASGPRQPEKFL